MQRFARLGIGILICVSGISGCGLFEKKPLPHPVEFALESPYGNVKTLAVAPTINLSGTREFDPLMVSDKLFEELQQVRGLNVLPLNKTLMAMNRLGIHNIDDPRVAQKLADALGADAIVIAAITAYDPYNPPTVGMTLQLYASTTSDPAMDEGTAARAEPVRTNPAGMIVIADASAPAAVKQPVSQVSAVFNASNQTVLREMGDFAVGRTQYDSALLDQKFLVDSDAYMRFVCHSMVRRLIDVERTRAADR